MAGRPLSYLASLPVDRVKGIGTVRAKQLSEAGIGSVAELLLHAPRRYLDRSQLFDLSAVPLGEEVTVAGTVHKVRRRRISRGRTMIDAVVGDGSSYLTAVWFNPYIKVREGSEVVLSGKVERFRGSLQMKAPDLDTMTDGDLITGRVVPIHPSAGGMGPVTLRRAIDNALRRSRPISDVIDPEILDRVGLIDRDSAIAAIHFPEERKEADVARSRLVFDEFFRLEVALARQQYLQVDEAVGVEHHADGPLTGALVDGLPYTLTSAQARVIEEIADDMARPHPMHRLLQGEVGSGKTVVAVAAMLMAIQSGYQGAVMAPTEVLAEQHFLGIAELLRTAGLGPPELASAGAAGTKNLFEGDDEGRASVRLGLLTSSSAEVNFLPSGAASRDDVTGWIRDGTIDLAIGTHALIQRDLEFARLGAAVVDEQHRFGVYQRVSLRDKAPEYDPDLLIMTATPIPRTLAMTLYGDLDVSLLDEMPPGRKPVRTRHVRPGSDDLDRMYGAVRSQVKDGRQVFVVCPLVDDSDKLEAAAATSEHRRLSRIFPELSVGLIHGQMRPRDKEAAMAAFREGSTDVLVATTVIEVGIDVPNATMMIVEDADRFGLSQLHQLRGRVGRGSAESWCYLVSDPPTPEAEARIGAMVETTDGFRLAREDLRIRGQGTAFGTRQAGLKDLRLGDILRDAELLSAARKEAFDLVARDPDLSEHSDLAEEIRLLLGSDVEWLFVS